MAGETKNVFTFLWRSFHTLCDKKGVINCQVTIATNGRTLCTIINDEAFALLLLENSHDHWVGIYH
jgi:hypothetical protein